MIVRLHHFDWRTYAERIMPALARWLTYEDDSLALQLFEKTRCAYEERYVPPTMRQLATWPRAHAFVRNLPRGMISRQEYQLLCDAEQFTAVSDRYVHHHLPQLYRHSEALLTVWGALIEQYCLPRKRSESEQKLLQSVEAMDRDELIALLQSAGLDELAQQVGAEGFVGNMLLENVEASVVDEDAADDELGDEMLATRPSWASPIYFTIGGKVAEREDQQEEIDEAVQEGVIQEMDEREEGLSIGRQPEQLHLRGWLAQHSVRAMALFELLACGRRVLPFGHQPGDPYGSYGGYLTPEESAQLADSLRTIQLPGSEATKADVAETEPVRRRSGSLPGGRLIDEMPPEHAEAFLCIVREAAERGSGLLCSIGQ